MMAGSKKDQLVDDEEFVCLDMWLVWRQLFDN